MKKVLGSFIIGATALSANGATWKAGDTDVSLKGYVKLDWVQTEGAGSAGSLNKQFTTPSQISKDQNGPRNGFQVFQTRFGIGTSTPTKMGPAKSYIEMDYYLTSPGNTLASENISNSYNPRLRHAFFNVGNWTFGQTWSTFMILSAFPEQLDFGGYAGINFARQGMIKHTSKVAGMTLDLALENAETTWGKGGTTLGSTTPAADQDSMPDVVAKISHSGGYGAFSVAAMYRTHESEEVGSDDTGVAFTAGGKIKYMGNNDVKVNFGWGNLGRYGSFTAFKDAITDNSGSKETVEATESMQWNVAVKHHITEMTRINVNYGSGEMDTFVSGDIESLNSLHVALIRQPMKSFLYGIEWSKTNVTRYGTNSTDTKVDEATSNRYMFSAQYTF